jgi:hypothetical protein
VRNLHRHRRAVDQHDLAAPVELISLTGGKAERNEGAHRCRRPLALPHPGHSAAQCRSRLRNRAHAAPRALGSASTVKPHPQRGSLLDADHPSNGVLFPRRKITCCNAGGLAHQSLGLGGLPARLGRHALRVGFITAAYDIGVRDEDIMRHTCHRATGRRRSNAVAGHPAKCLTTRPGSFLRSLS